MVRWRDVETIGLRIGKAKHADEAWNRAPRWGLSEEPKGASYAHYPVASRRAVGTRSRALAAPRNLVQRPPARRGARNAPACMHHLRWPTVVVAACQL
jgi:hypothetical protein